MGGDVAGGPVARHEGRLRRLGDGAARRRCGDGEGSCEGENLDQPEDRPWGSIIRITGRVRGGYVPTDSKLLQLNVGIGRIGHIEGLPDIRPNGSFVILWKFDAGQGVVHPWFSVATLPEAAFPYSSASSNRVTVTLGEPTPQHSQRERRRKHKTSTRRGVKHKKKGKRR